MSDPVQREAEAASSEDRRAQRRLGRAIHDLRESVTQVERGGRLNNGALIGTSLPVYDDDDNLAMEVGQQYDGSYTATPIRGPVPDTPTAPIVRPGLRSVTVFWDGEWEPLFEDDGETVFDDAVVASMDFSRVEIHLSEDPAFEPETIATLVGTFETPRGGEQIVPVPTAGLDLTVKLVARTTAGARGGASDGVLVRADEVGTSDGLAPTEAPVAVALAQRGAVLLLWDAVDNRDPVTYRIYAHSTSAVPIDEAHRIGDTIDTAFLASLASLDPATPVPYLADTHFRVAAVDMDGEGPPGPAVAGRPERLQAADLADGIISLAKLNVGVADTLASAAEESADAIAAATAALTTAQAAQATADGAIRTHYESERPWPDESSQPESVLGDLWFDVDDGQAYRWNGSIWQIIEDSSIAVALAAAQSAQTTADSKIETYFRTSRPWPDGDTTHDLDFGDLWTDTTARAGNRAYYWSTARAWTAVPVGLGGLGGDVTARALGSITTTVSATGPVGPRAGDLWMDSANQNRIKRWSGSAWVEVRDAGIQEALTKAAAAADLADEKIRTFYEPAHPEGLYPQSSPTMSATDVGDLWFRTDDGNRPYRWAGPTDGWVVISLDAAVLPTRAPTASPPITITGLPDAVVLQLLTRLENGARVQYHLSTVDGFTPSAETAVGPVTFAGVSIVKSLPDGMPLALGVTYYARAVAVNGVGSASASAQVSGSLDVEAVRSVVAESITAGFVLTERIQIGQAYIDANEGFVIPNPDGTRSLIPFDGSPMDLVAMVTALTFTASGVATFLALVRVQRRIQVGDGIAAPTFAPEVTSHWPSVGLTIGAGESAQAIAAHPSDPERYVVAVQPSGDGASPVRVLSVPRAGGDGEEVLRMPSEGAGAGRAVRGLAVAGGRYWLLCTSVREGSVGWKLVGISTTDTTDVVIRDLATPGSTFGTRRFEYRPALGTNEDSSSLLVGYVVTSSSGSRSIRVEAYRASDGARGNEFVLQGNVDADVTDLAWIGQGTYNHGSQRVIVQPTGGSGRVWSGSVAQATRQGAEDFPRADLAVITGMCWDGTRLQALAAGLRIAAHSRARTTRQDITVGYAWAGSAADGSTIETGIGPTWKSTISAQAQAMVTTPTPPEADLGDPSKANRVAVYALVGASQRRQVVGSRGARATTLDVLTSTGRTPGVVGAFDSSPADVAPERGTTDAEKPWLLRGSGGGRVGVDFEWNPAGDITVGPRSAAAIRKTGVKSGVERGLANDTASNNPRAVTFATAFPSGTIPVLTVTVESGAAPNNVSVAVTSVSATGFNIISRRNSGSGSIDVHWTASLPSNS